VSAMRRRSAGLTERGEGRGGAEGGGPCLGQRGGYAAGGGGRCAGLGRVRGAAGMGGADGAQRGGRREPRAAGAGWAVAVAARLEAEQGAQSSVVSAMQRGWSAERREGVAGKCLADGSGI
jgi:hypothetical protein